MSQLADPQNERYKGTLPSQPIINPRNSQQAHLSEDQSLNQCNAVHTLRSGKKVDNQVSTSSNSIQHNHTQASISSTPNPFKSDESEIVIQSAEQVITTARIIIARALNV